MNRQMMRNIGIIFLLTITEIILIRAWITDDSRYNQKAMEQISSILTIITIIYLIIRTIRLFLFFSDSNLYHHNKNIIAYRKDSVELIYDNKQLSINEYSTSFYFFRFFDLLHKIMVSTWFAWFTIVFFYVLEVFDTDLTIILNTIREQFHSKTLQILLIIPATLLLIYVLISLIWRFLQIFPLMTENIYHKFVALSLLESSSRILIAAAISYVLYLYCVDNQIIFTWILIPFGITILIEILYFIVNIIKYLPHVRKSR